MMEASEAAGWALVPRHGRAKLEFPGLESRLHSGMGWGLWATRQFDTGEKLFSELPCVACPLFEQSRCCGLCLVELAELAEPMDCPRGCGERYCSAGCRDEAEWRYHHQLCSTRSPIWSEYLAEATEAANEYYVLAARLLVASNGRVPLADWAQAPFWDTLDSDGQPRAAFDSAVEAQLNGQHERLGRVIGLELSIEQWAGLLGMLRQNVLGCEVIRGAGCECVGLGLFEKHSLLNHSCTPNAMCASDGWLGVTVLADRPIAAGEQVLVNYLPDTEPIERGEVLKEQFGFECTCNLCATKPRPPRSPDVALRAV